MGGYCTGVICDESKVVAPPSFNPNCDTRQLGGIGGILIACNDDKNIIPLTNGDGTGIDLKCGKLEDGSTDATSADIVSLIEQFVDNTKPLDATDTDPHYLYLCVDAELPETTDELQEETNCSLEKVINRGQTIAGDIYATNLDNIKFALELQKGTGSYRAWFVTKAGQFGGGNEGIPFSFTKINYTLPKSPTEVQKISFVMNWDCLTQPPIVPLGLVTQNNDPFSAAA